MTTLSYEASKTAISTAAVDHGVATLPQPARGEAKSAALADGFPVWIVQHEDGTVTVLSAAAPPRPKRAGTGRGDVVEQVDRSLVAWIPGVRRFYAGGMFYDERGHVLGYAAFDACLGDCSRIEDMPLMLRDLDTFAVTDRHTVAVGPLVAGAERRRAETWLPWRRSPGREQDMHASDAPALAKLTPGQAFSLRDGAYAVVDGDVVRSTDAEPQLCTRSTQPGACGKCIGDHLPLAGITGSDAAHIHSDGWWKDPAQYEHDRNAVYTEAEPGTFLVRRQGASFVIVAGIFRGMCSGGS